MGKGKRKWEWKWEPHPPGLSETAVVPEVEDGNAGRARTLDSYLELAAECTETLEKMVLRNFNNEQCAYLVHKLKVVVQTARLFVEAEAHRPSSFVDIARHVETFKLLVALANQIVSFVQDCCRDAWIQAAMTWMNVAEHVSLIGTNLELCKVAFFEQFAAAQSLSEDRIVSIIKAQVEIVESKASADVETLLARVILELSSLKGMERDLATYLLQRLLRVQGDRASFTSTSPFLSAIDDESYWGRLFQWVKPSERLGKGMAATVHKATWLGMPVAKKTFKGLHNPYFTQEVRILGKLCHPNITSMFCGAREKYWCAIIMELMDEDLHDLMQRRLTGSSDSYPFPILEAVDIMLQIGEGVNYLHNRKIVHRDLKSQNILVKTVKARGVDIEYVHAKVANFGLSKTKESSTTYSNQTVNIGTTRCMAPEIIEIIDRGSQRETSEPKYPFKCDVYGFAMVCYEILSGCEPFFEERFHKEIKKKVVNGERPSLPDHCPSSLKTLIQQCWTPEPEERPPFALICSRLKYLKYLLMTGSETGVEGPNIEREFPKTWGKGPKTWGKGPKTWGEGPKIEGEGPKTWGEGPRTSTMSLDKTLELVVSTIKLLEGARPSTIDNIPGNSFLFMLILSQLWRSRMLLNDLPIESILDWHNFIFEELQRAVNRTSTLVGQSRDISMIPTEAMGEHFLETLLDLRWWTWVIALQAGMVLEYYFGAFEGVLEAKSPSGDSTTRRLPSYSFERWQEAEIEGRLEEILQLKSKGKRMSDQGENETNMLLTKIRKAELPLFIIKALSPTTIQDAKKPSSIQDYLEIDLTQDLLGASSTGYVIRTTCSDGEEGFCALKKINTMDDKPPDLAKLWHPHVVHLKHHWSEETALHDVARGWIPKSTFVTFLVMELMDCDLATLISKTGIALFSLRVAVDVMLQIAKGMLYLHEMGVSHPHLKCENVLCKILQNRTEIFREGEGRANLGDVLIKLGGFGCSRPATLHNKKWDVFCFGLTCLEILTGKEYWSEDIYGADASSIPTIPETTPLILKYCIASCLDKELALNFSEVVMLLLLAQLQIMRTYEGGTMLSIESLHIENEQTRNQDSASFSRSYGYLQEELGDNQMFHVRELHPQLGADPTPVQITLIFFHGFPKVSEEWRLTWITRDNKLLWPQKWLPEDLDGNIRVLSLSFDDTLDVSSNRIQPDSEISKALLQTLVLSATWKLGEIEHAIVLVGHGFGGVIIKLLVTEAQSFVRNAQQNSKDFQDVEVMRCKRFLESLASVVFYSVPHDHAPTNTEFKNYILGCSKTRVLQRSSMVKSLRGDDRFIGEMIQLSEDFENALPHKTKVLAFLEGEPMSKNLFLVTEKSYAGLSWMLHKVEKDNHFEVCRPDSKSHTGYKALLLHIQQHMFSIPTDEIVKEPGGAAGYS